MLKLYGPYPLRENKDKFNKLKNKKRKIGHDSRRVQLILPVQSAKFAQLR
jgi:hypothetical protein